MRQNQKRARVQRKMGLGHSAAELEKLEGRLLLSGTRVLLGQQTLPGANSIWDYSDGPFYPSAIMADLNGDGKQEVVTVGGDGNLYAYKYDQLTASKISLYGSANQTGTGTLAPIQSTPVVTTRSPTATLVTSSPTSRTVPAHW